MLSPNALRSDNGFDADDNAYINSSEWSKVVLHGEARPESSYKFHKAIFGNAVQNWNMQQLFTDFLSFRGGSASRVRGNYGDDEPEHLWLGGQAMAAQDLGCEVQFCMAAAHQILMSLEWPAVTNARANGDGGLELQSLVYTSVLAGMVGLGWSKDNLRTADRCYVAPAATACNGSAGAAKCNGRCATQFVNGKFQSQTSQTILATLSLGPVGISDQLTARPDEAGANITSNKTLVMATCTTNGSLLQPGYPLTPIEPVLLHADGWQPSGNGKHGGAPKPAPHLWATYTAVAANTSVDVHFCAVGYAVEGGKGFDPKDAQNFSLPVTLEERHLASMVDSDALPSPEGFRSIPTGGFRGAGESFPNSTNDGYVWWSASLVQQADAADACAGVEISQFDESITLALPADGERQPALANFAPLHGDTALLGEAGKVTAVSVFRFASVDDAAGGGLHVKLRGAPKEVVSILFAKKQAGGDARGGRGGGFVCVAKKVTIGADGTAEVASRAPTLKTDDGAGNNPGAAMLRTCVPDLLGAQRKHQVFDYEEGLIKQPLNDGLCLTATDSFEVQPAPGGPRGRSWGIEMAPCEKAQAANQTWELKPQGSIVLSSLGLCIDIAGYGKTSGARAHLWPCTTVPPSGHACPPTAGCPSTTCTCVANQQWDWRPSGAVTSLMSGLCLDAGSTGMLPKLCDAAPANASAACDRSLTPEARAVALVASANLTERVANLAVQTPGFPRLGVPAPTFGEALHGVVTPCATASGPNSTGCATSFPHALALSASFNASLWTMVGDVVGLEGRAMHNEGVGGGGGVAYFAPNVNLYRVSDAFSTSCMRVLWSSLTY